MVMFANEVETKEKHNTVKIAWDKTLTTTYTKLF